MQMHARAGAADTTPTLTPTTTQTATPFVSSVCRVQHGGRMSIFAIYRCILRVLRIFHLASFLAPRPAHADGHAGTRVRAAVMCQPANMAHAG